MTRRIDASFGVQTAYTLRSVLNDLVKRKFGTLLTILVIAVSLTIPTVSYLLWKNLHLATTQFYPESELTIYLHKNLSEEDANLVVEKIRQQEGVESLNYVSRQDSLKEFKSWSGFGEELEILDDNPLPAVVMVKPSKAFNESEKRAELRANLNKIKGVQEVRLDNDWMEKLTALSQELTELKTTLSEKEKHFAEQQQHIEQSKQQLGVEFQNLANRILEEKSQSFNQTNQTALETLLKPFREQIEGFQKRVNEIHSESVKGNAGLEAEIKKVLEIGLNMSQEANNLTSALKGEKKTLGNWGEVQLERALQLAGLIENVHYSAQAHFKDEQGGRNYPDFVLNLPDEKNIIIDSKMSLNAYESAVNTEDEFERERLLREHIKALKNHIDDLHRKDYSNLIGMRSPNFVLMFIAVEPAYIEALKLDPSLFNYCLLYTSPSPRDTR